MNTQRMLCGIAVFIIGIRLFFSEYSEAFPDACRGQAPHYLLGVTQPQNQIDVLFQIGQNFVSSTADSRGSSVWGANLGEKINFTFYGHTVTIYFPMYRRAGSSVYYHTAAGVEELTLQEFECVKADLYEWIKSGIDGDFADHEMITEIAINTFAQFAGKSSDEIRRIIAQQIPEYRITYGDVYKIPILERVDFIQSIRHIYYSPMRSCNAAVFAIKDVMFLTPCLRRADHIMGHPETIKHELIHANIKLQDLPLGWYVNVELMAALLPFLESPVNLDTFFYHLYLQSPWEILKVFGGFDIAKVRQDIFQHKVLGGGAAINREKLEKYIPEINRAAHWLRETGMKVLAEYYSNQHFWTAVNHKSGDEEMMYRVIMAKLYEPTLLGGHANTMRFILKHAAESPRITKNAWGKVGKPKKIATRNENETQALAELRHMAEIMGITPEMMERIGIVYGMRGPSISEIRLEALQKIMRDFINKEGFFSSLDKGEAK